VWAVRAPILKALPLVAALVLMVSALATDQQALLAALPALLLFAALLSGWFPGERSIARVLARQTPRLRHGAAALAPGRRMPLTLRTTGGELAAGFSRRGPPRFSLSGN
jgi:hypothetical protein